jgi:hypothetical protein
LIGEGPFRGVFSLMSEGSFSIDRKHKKAFGFTKRFSASRRCRREQDSKMNAPMGSEFSGPIDST